MTQEPKIFPYIERLLQGTEVVWTTLGDEKKIEIANANRRPVKASERISGNIPYYGANNIQDYVEGYTHEGTYILIAEDGTKSIENYSVQWATGKFWANNHVHVLRCKNNVDSRFIYYYLQTVNFVPFLTGGDRAKLTKAKLLEIPIPLPPLSVQQEIVRILDKFTTLEAELEAELDCRKRQYEYYRNKLLTLNEIEGAEIIWKTLGEVLDIYTGGEAPKNLIRGERPQGSFIYPIYSNGEEIYGFTDNYRINKDAVTISSIGAKTGTIYFRKAYFTPIIRLKVLVPKNEKTLNSRYVFHYLSNITISTKRSSVPNINANEVKSIKIPLPPLEEQQRIATILDKFDTLVNSISEGLPREIELRKKQYEYYREQLLTFPSSLRVTSSSSLRATPPSSLRAEGEAIQTSKADSEAPCQTKTDALP